MGSIEKKAKEKSRRINQKEKKRRKETTKKHC
jgi:hypothetical protein